MLQGAPASFVVNPAVRSARRSPGKQEFRWYLVRHSGCAAVCRESAWCCGRLVVCRTRLLTREDPPGFCLEKMNLEMCEDARSHDHSNRNIEALVKSI